MGLGGFPKVKALRGYLGVSFSNLLVSGVLGCIPGVPLSVKT
jgi:hypothetical protein